MSTDLVLATRQMSLEDAERMLLSSGVDELFVVDERGWLCGVVPDYELLKTRMTPSHDSGTVESIMSRRFLVIGPETPLSVAGRYLREHVHRRLAVVEERRLIGQITRRSVLKWLRSIPEFAAGSECQPAPDREMRRREDDEPSLRRRVPKNYPRSTAPAT